MPTRLDSAAWDRRGNTVIPSLATSWPDHGQRSEFRVNYCLRSGLDPAFSAADVIAGRIGRQLTARRSWSDLPPSAGRPVHAARLGQGSGVYIHIIGAETLKAGTPIDLGWIPPILAAVCCLRRIKREARRPGRVAGGGHSHLPFRCCWSGRRFSPTSRPDLFVILGWLPACTMQNMKAPRPD
jgi:hypothetical protein